MANTKKFAVKNGLTTQNISFVDSITSTQNTINIDMTSNDTLSFAGESGQLFSVTDSMEGTIFSVNDISGVPSIEVLDDGTVKVAEYSGNVGIGTSNPSEKLEVNGSFAATTKSFKINHPTKPNKFLQYGSLESPYHGVRLTGKAVIINSNVVTVDLPDYISELCKEEDIQVQVTNIRHGKVLWVEEIDIPNNRFTICMDKEDNTGMYEFYWSFTAIRKDIDDLIVEEDKGVA